jgi:hypothetical protein
VLSTSAARGCSRKCQSGRRLAVESSDPVAPEKFQDLSQSVINNVALLAPLKRAMHLNHKASRSGAIGCIILLIVLVLSVVLVSAVLRLCGSHL